MNYYTINIMKLYVDIIFVIELQYFKFMELYLLGLNYVICIQFMIKRIYSAKTLPNRKKWQTFFFTPLLLKTLHICSLLCIFHYNMRTVL